MKKALLISSALAVLALLSAALKAYSVTFFLVVL